MICSCMKFLPQRYFKHLTSWCRCYVLSRAWCCLFPLIGHFGFLSRLPLSTRSQTSLPRSREEVFGDVLVKKQACLGNRNMDLKKRKPWHFFKGDSPWVGQKVNFFFSFIFVKNRSRKSVCWCSRYKRSLQRQEEQSFMKNAKWEFFQRGRSIFFIKSFRFRQLCFLCKINKKKTCFVTFSLKKSLSRQ